MILVLWIENVSVMIQMLYIYMAFGVVIEEL